jgi:hypothetical protein
MNAIVGSFHSFNKHIGKKPGGLNQMLSEFSTGMHGEACDLFGGE